MNENKFSYYSGLYRTALDSPNAKEEIGDEKQRGQTIAYFSQITEERISAFTDDELFTFLSKTWSGEASFQRHSMGKDVFYSKNQGLDFVKKSLISFLFGKEDVTVRWDNFKLVYIADGTKSELLGMYYPDDCAIFNKRTRDAMAALGIDAPKGANISGKQYQKVCDSMKLLGEKLKKTGFVMENLLAVDYFLYEISTKYLKQEKAIAKANAKVNAKAVKVSDLESRPLPKVKLKISQNIRGSNLIYYGVPGCGKSYLLQQKFAGLPADQRPLRTTFYLDYSYSDFVGQLTPVSQNNRLDYVFIPGPFSKALKKAFDHPDMEIILIIEEMNRGNAPAIFGSCFQLLDRRSGDVTCSQFPIEDRQIRQYLNGTPENPGKVGEYLDSLREQCRELEIGEDTVLIPNNLSIYGTMNTSDQSVFPLDNAFKRRFNFEHISNDFDDNDQSIRGLYVPGTAVTWEDFVNQVNAKIRKDASTPFEDKQIGKRFVSETLLSKSSNNPDQNLRRRFAMKVLEYLWDDVSKANRGEWFAPDKSFDELISDFSKTDPTKDVLSLIFNGSLFGQVQN
jgi:hypothetical protein